MSPIRWILRLSLILLCLPQAQPVTTPGDVRTAFQEFAGFPAEYSVISAEPAEFSAKLIQLRHRLRDYALGSVIDAAARANRMDSIAEIARQRIAEAKLPLESGARWMPSGQSASATIEVRTVEGAPEWIGAIVRIGLPCGSDYSAYFLHVAPGTSENARFETSFQLATEMGGEPVPIGWADYAVAAHAVPDSNALRVATIATGGGCSSYWRPLSMQILSSAEQAYRPEKLFEAQRPAYLGTVERPAVKSLRDGFEFGYQTGFSLDLDRHIRSAQTKVIINGNTAHIEVPKLADPAEFLDEWVSTPWQESKNWASGRGNESLKSWHQALSATARNRSVTELVGTGECWDSALVWVRVDRGESPATTRTVYGLLRKSDSGFRVERFAEELPPTCRNRAVQPAPAIN